jgi:RNA polymerase sigma-70 factor (ECF subfamily)
MSQSLDRTASDVALVDAVWRAGSHAAFGILYDRHTPRAYQTAWRILGGRRDAVDDAVQEAWSRAIGSLDLWREDSAFGPWFRTITAHAAIDALRRDWRFEPEVDVEWEGGEDDGDRIDLEMAIAALPPGYRAVLVLHDVEGFTHEEIGLRLGITAGTSKGQLFKARRAVRAMLSPRIEGRA